MLNVSMCGSEISNYSIPCKFTTTLIILLSFIPLIINFVSIYTKNYTNQMVILSTVGAIVVIYYLFFWNAPDNYRCSNESDCPLFGINLLAAGYLSYFIFDPTFLISNPVRPVNSSLQNNSQIGGRRYR